MANAADEERNSHAERRAAGFAKVDNKGRLALPKDVRGALGVHSGSTVAYVLAGTTLLVVPQDEHLGDLMERASEAVAMAGLTAQDYLDELPSARDELMREAYGDAFVQILQDQHAAVTEQPRGNGEPAVANSQLLNEDA